MGYSILANCLGNILGDTMKEKNFMTGLKNRFYEKFKSANIMLMEMYHTNGTISHFIIATKVHKFEHRGMAYVIDEEKKVYCNSTKMYMLRYHEGFALPFSIDISAQKMKKASKGIQDLDEIATSFNPYVLKDVLKFEYAKGVIQGAEVSEFIKRSFFISIVTLLAVLIHLIVNAYKMGWV